MATTAQQVTEGMGDVREDVAARLERLARLVRVSPVQDAAVFEAAYQAVGTLSQALQPLWKP